MMIQRFALLNIIILMVAGCSTTRSFMPTPNLFSAENSYSVESGKNAVDGTELKLLYVTDRRNESVDKTVSDYRQTRSNAMAFGELSIGLEPSLNWQQLSDISDGSRGSRVKYGSYSAVEHGQYPASPYLFSFVDGEVNVDAATRTLLKSAKEQFSDLIKKRMSEQDTKDVVIFVHGFNNTFEYAAQTLGGLWHFMERKPVPILYSWPAGAGGIRGYFIDRVSGMFTVFHLKEMLRTLFDTPEIEKIQIIAHSRGTDIITTALRELIIEHRGHGTSAKSAFKIENLILAAPDLDYGVIRQRLMAEAFATALGRVTVYTTNTDKALSISQLLMKGVRFGLLAPKDIDVRDRSILERVGNVDFVQAQNVKSLSGHDYFFSNSDVSSDLLTTLVHSASPGSELRPLEHQHGNFWLIPPDYLKNE